MIMNPPHSTYIILKTVLVSALEMDPDKAVEYILENKVTTTNSDVLTIPHT